MECQVSTDGTLKCPLLYCKNVVMYSEAQAAEQKQEGQWNVYSIRALWYYNKRFSQRDEKAVTPQGSVVASLSEEYY